MRVLPHVEYPQSKERESAEPDPGVLSLHWVEYWGYLRSVWKVNAPITRNHREAALLERHSQQRMTGATIVRRFSGTERQHGPLGEEAAHPIRFQHFDKSRQLSLSYLAAADFYQDQSKTPNPLLGKAVVL